MSLENKSVLVTGGNGGIGRHLVERLIGLGARTTVADRIREGCPAGAAYTDVDLADLGSVYRLGESMRSDPPDILVNLAGINAFEAYECMQRSEIDKLMQVNLLAPMQLIHMLLPAMITRRSGHIVNMGSVVGAIGLPYFAAYAASKAGIEKFSESLRRELSARGITVTYVAPRAVNTAMNHGPIEQFNAQSGSRADAPDKVAGIIARAIVRKRTRVPIGFPERFFIKLNALSPSLVDRGLTRNRRLAETVLAAQQ